MKVFIGADHRGFKLKEWLRGWLMGLDYDVVDCGAFELDEEDDYVDFATRVAKKVKGQNANLKIKEPACAGRSATHLYESQDRGIVICGSGVGVCIAANKVKGIRCGLGINEEQVRAARRDDDMNVLALAADFVDVEGAKKMAEAFLKTEFSGRERHRRRLEKITELE